MSNENVEQQATSQVIETPIDRREAFTRLPQSALESLLLAQDLRVGMTLKEYEVPRG